MKLFFALLFFVGLLTAGCSSDSEHESPVDPTLVATCAECHGEGNAAIAGWPPLTSMTEAEIVAKLTGHRARVIEDSTMSRVAHDLTDEQIRQLARYFANKAPAP